VSGNHHGRHHRSKQSVGKAAPVARPAAPVEDPGPFLTFTTKLGLVLIVILSIGLSALIAFAPERKENDEPAVSANDRKTEGEKKADSGDKAEKKPADKEEKKPADKEEKKEEKKPEKKEEKKPADKEEKKPADKKKEKETEKPKEKEKEKPAEKKPADKDKDKEKDKEKEKPAEKKPPEKGGAEVVFEKHVLPIFTAKCVMCHGVSGKGGVDLRTMKSIAKGSGNGNILTKGDLKKSLLWEVIDTDQMPQSDEKLTAEEKDTIKKWILGGAKEMAAK
jgi:hypothetical protein